MTRAFLGLWLATLAIGAPARAQAQARAADSTANYVASSKGRVYYWIGCNAWRSLSRQNLIHFRTAEEAERRGYTPSRAQGCAPQVHQGIEPPGRDNPQCRVTRVIDGDTFECAGGVRVRLLLIDTPELGQGPFGTAARDSAARLLPEGTTVRLEFDVQLRDRYDRLLAYVFAGDEMVNRRLARAGMALASVYPPNVRYIERIRAAIDSARAERAGLWARDAFACPPADFRAGRCRD